MKIWLRLVVCLTALAALLTNPFAADATHPTVVELFQSPGCSDSPPAVANALRSATGPTSSRSFSTLTSGIGSAGRTRSRNPNGLRVSTLTPTRSEATASIRRR
jgi:hypothetical protein